MPGTMRYVFMAVLLPIAGFLLWVMWGMASEAWSASRSWRRVGVKVVAVGDFGAYDAEFSINGRKVRFTQKISRGVTRRSTGEQFELLVNPENPEKRRDVSFKDFWIGFSMLGFFAAVLLGSAVFVWQSVGEMDRTFRRSEELRAEMERRIAAGEKIPDEDDGEAEEEAAVPAPSMPLRRDTGRLELREGPSAHKGTILWLGVAAILTVLVLLPFGEWGIGRGISVLLVLAFLAFTVWNFLSTRSTLVVADGETLRLTDRFSEKAIGFSDIAKAERRGTGSVFLYDRNGRHLGVVSGTLEPRADLDRLLRRIEAR
ncbi:MAG TPA: hypothetical protein DEH78_18440 [Solibacterales bacterium]|nr:hypothetical protein [Bryobacterales bacterium]